MIIKLYRHFDADKTEWFNANLKKYIEKLRNTYNTLDQTRRPG